MKPISGVGKDEVYVQIYERDPVHPKWLRSHTPLWTWYKTGRITRIMGGEEEYITSRSFYDADTLAELICDHAGPDATEYPAHKVKYERAQKDGSVKTTWAFQNSRDIAEYARTGKRPPERRKDGSTNWNTVSDDDMFPNADEFTMDDDILVAAEQALRDTAHIYPKARTMTFATKTERRMR